MICTVISLHSTFAQNLCTYSLYWHAQTQNQLQAYSEQYQIESLREILIKILFFFKFLFKKWTTLKYEYVYLFPKSCVRV